MELVSVVVTCYNKEKYIAETIESVLQQSHENFELIIINDGSTDNSSKIIKSFNDSRLKLIELNNSGVNVARNIGILASKGTKLAFLDGDDIWHQHKIESQLKYMTNNDLDMCFCDYDTIDDTGQINHSFVKINFPYFNYEKLKNKILGGNVILGSASSVIFNKEIIDKIGLFDEELKWGEDWEYWMRIVIFTDKIGFLEKQLTFLRFGINQVQTTLNKKKRYSDSLYILKKALRSYKLTQKEKSLVYIALCKIHYSYGTDWCNFFTAYIKALNSNYRFITRFDIFYLLIKLSIKKILFK